MYQPKNRKLPKIAIGLDDLAGSGFFEREYIVFSKDTSLAKFSLGAGTGKFTGENAFRNPISYIYDSFSSRSQRSKNIDVVGQLSYDQWFKGDIGIFGGFEYSLPFKKGLTFKAEYDPFNYIDFSAGYDGDANLDIRNKDSNFNLGIHYPINDYFSVDIAYIKGNTFNFSWNIGINVNKNYVKKKSALPKISNEKYEGGIELEFYRDLLSNLNSNRLYLQSANLEKLPTTDKHKVDIVINQDTYQNTIQSSSYAAYIVNEVAKNNDIEMIQTNVSEMNAGITLNTIKYLSESLDPSEKYIELIKRDTAMTSGDPKTYQNSKYVPIVKYPNIFYSIEPELISHIGSPDKFYYGGLAASFASEIQFNRNLYLSSQFMSNIVDNFDRKESFTDSPYLPNVRTEILDYLQQGDDLYVTNLELNYYKQLKKNIFTKVSFGIFERMYGGYGGEFLYKPFNEDISIGFDYYSVYKRNYDQRFKFLDYKTETGHIKAVHYSQPFGILSTISYGKYLAKDKGFTFDFARFFGNGAKVGFFFTLTDISFEEFGEGSFDKGFYFNFPLDIFSKNYNGDNFAFKLRPLTRDGGAKLEIRSLSDILHSSSMYQINSNSNWIDFLQ